MYNYESKRCHLVLLWNKWNFFLFSEWKKSNENNKLQTIPSIFWITRQMHQYSRKRYLWSEESFGNDIAEITSQAFKKAISIFWETIFCWINTCLATILQNSAAKYHWYLDSATSDSYEVIINQKSYIIITYCVWLEQGSNPCHPQKLERYRED